jgi:hypothetical protein
VQSVTDFATTAIVAIGIAVAAIVLATIMGVRALRRPLSEEQFHGEQSEARLLGVLAVSSLVLLGVALIGLVLWFASGVLHGMGGIGTHPGRERRSRYVCSVGALGWRACHHNQEPQMMKPTAVQ